MPDRPFFSRHLWHQHREVAVALLATRQPEAPRSETLLAPVELAPVREPVSAGELRPVLAAAAVPLARENLAAGDEGVACAPGDSQASEAVTRASEAATASGGRIARFTAGNSCLRPADRVASAPPHDQLVRILSKQILSRGAGPGDHGTDPAGGARGHHQP